MALAIAIVAEVQGKEATQAKHILVPTKVGVHRERALLRTHQHCTTPECTTTTTWNKINNERKMN